MVENSSATRIKVTSILNCTEFLSQKQKIPPNFNPLFSRITVGFSQKTSYNLKMLRIRPN